MSESQVPGMEIIARSYSKYLGLEEFQKATYLWCLLLVGIYRPEIEQKIQRIYYVSGETPDLSSSSKDIGVLQIGEHILAIPIASLEDCMRQSIHDYGTLLPKPSHWNAHSWPIRTGVSRIKTAPITVILPDLESEEDPYERIEVEWPSLKPVATQFSHRKAFERDPELLRAIRAFTAT